MQVPSVRSRIKIQEGCWGKGMCWCIALHFVARAAKLEGPTTYSIYATHMLMEAAVRM